MHCTTFPLTALSIPNISQKHLFVSSQHESVGWECPSCQTAASFHKTYSFEESADASWFIWKTDEEAGRMLKTVEEGTTYELVEYICEMLPQSLEHCFIKHQQAMMYSKCREEATSDFGFLISAR